MYPGLFPNQIVLSQLFLSISGLESIEFVKYSR